MRPHQIIKKAEEMEISTKAALAMRKRYLLGVFDEWADYIDGKTNTIPLITLDDAIDEIVAIRKFETRKPTKGDITDDMIQSAREYPISSLVELDKGKMLCFVHQEKTPSMQLHEKRNRLHCFGCGWDGGPIDICMERDGMTFIEAVRWLGR